MYNFITNIERGSATYNNFQMIINTCFRKNFQIKSRYDTEKNARTPKRFSATFHSTRSQRVYEINLHQSCIYLQPAQLRTKRLCFPGSQCYPDGIPRQNARCKSVFKYDALPGERHFSDGDIYSFRSRSLSLCIPPLPARLNHRRHYHHRRRHISR